MLASLCAFYLIQNQVQKHNECSICDPIIVVTSSEFLDSEHAYGYGDS